MIIGNPIIIGSGGGGATLIEKQISANGTYRASADSADGYSRVTVNVPQPTIVASKTVTSNGTYRAADEDAAGYGVIVVNVSSGGSRCPRAEQTATMELDALFADFSLVVTATEVTE